MSFTIYREASFIGQLVFVFKIPPGVKNFCLHRLAYPDLTVLAIGYRRCFFICAGQG